VFGYRLKAIRAGTKVTSYSDWSDIHEQYSAPAAEHFPIISETNLRTTLSIDRSWNSGTESTNALDDSCGLVMVHFLTA
jgi:hypothetical protein|tara:strand:- start:163 stop:399 length:237 start_codon:yes stop_codon:yes gene_type:complete